MHLCVLVSNRVHRILVIPILAFTSHRTPVSRCFRRTKRVIHMTRIMLLSEQKSTTCIETKGSNRSLISESWRNHLVVFFDGWMHTEQQYIAIVSYLKEIPLDLNRNANTQTHSCWSYCASTWTSTAALGCAINTSESFPRFAFLASS